MYVEVALPVPVRHAFTYAVPDRLRQSAEPGVLVRVPFGTRVLLGVVLGPAARPDAAHQVKELQEIVGRSPEIPGPILALARWLTDYYLAPPGEALRVVLPPGALDPRLARARPPGGAEVLVRRIADRAEPARLPRSAHRLRAVLAALDHAGRRDGWISLQALRALVSVASEDLRRLVQRGLVETAEGSVDPGPAVEAARDAPSASGTLPDAWPRPTPAQAAAAARLTTAIDAASGGVFLLRGVTGSGKTEVYFAAARRALDRGRGVIFMVPEIGLTPAFTRRVRERFGDQVAVLHSGLPAGARRAAWERIRAGHAPLVVGPRSALFAPVARLGLVVVDEEHDPSYKQEETPRYHGRDLALVRARLESAVAILGSATPSIESWTAARAGRYGLLELGERIGGRPLPDVEIVDMREEFRARGEPVLLSSRLTTALTLALARGEQAVVLLNRRGYAAFALCRACGEPVGCPRCSVSLVYHRTDESMRCHYCDYRRGRLEACERCASPHLAFQGEGTERIERHLERALPGARIARLDRDTARGRGASERILAAFEAGDTDVLVGTQMVAKGHDFPRVTVVGVLGADAVLGFPDFRAAERTFQLLTQVAGRAGRGDLPGIVIVQAYRKDHYAVTAAVRHDAIGFYEKEIEYRRALAYPPFTNLAALTVVGKDPSRAAARAADLARRLEANGGGRVRVLGPALAPIARLRGLFRFQVLLKARARRRLGDALRRTLDAMAEEKLGTRDITVDVDPIHLL